MARTLTILTSPTPFSTAKSMIWLFLSLLLVSRLGPGNSVSEDSSPPLVVNGVLGESVTLPSNFSEKENIMSITWLHKGNSVIFISPKEAKIQVTDPKRKDQLNVTKSYSLQINNLTMADVGHYRAQITTSNSYLNTDYNLQIFRRLSNLQVAHHTKRSENNTCEIQLTCSVENPNDNVSFRWQVAGIPYHSETNLSISWDPKSLSEETYTCIAENPVSFLSSSVSDKSVCEGVINGKNEYLDIRWIIIVVVLTCFFQFSTQQTQCPAETVSNLEYASFSSGNTVYAQVTHSNKETKSSNPVKNYDSTTIYSEVNHPQERKPIYSKTTAHHNVVFRSTNHGSPRRKEKKSKLEKKQNHHRLQMT
ncbi:SLAM family member 6 isoform X4 [Ovis aries]|uniref:SLAM family member 6 isoform X4 n=2 Tax=Ovis aries TaxID=9940 RepID=UPI001C2E26D7|nr:SLAM family member 6 isoform X4 [Ovis aries]